MAVEMTTADVYETASIIGQDFEKIIDIYGHEAVVDLMPKIERVLEQMEAIVADGEKQFMEMASLRMENERLYGEIRKEASIRRRVEEELYQMRPEEGEGEEADYVQKLREENRQLKMEAQAHAEYEKAGQNMMAGDIQMMHKMKETIDQQRDMIRSKNSEVNGLRGDIEAMEEQIQRLTDVNEVVRKQMNNLQNNVNEAIKEKTKVQAEMQGLQQELEQLRRSGVDRGSMENRAKSIVDVAKPMEDNRIENELVENHFSRDNQEETKSEVPRNPDRPRFTLRELQKVLWERDLLKMQVYTLEDELSHYKPREEETTDGDSGMSSPVKEEDVVQSSSAESPANPVHRESGISKFFHLFWRDKNKISSGTGTADWEVVDRDGNKIRSDEGAETEQNMETTEAPSTDL